HAVLVKCSKHLADIVSRSSQRDPEALTIGPVHHRELHATVVHAVMNLRGCVPNASHYRTLITRSYAEGVDKTTCFPTKESVRAICIMLDSAAAGMEREEATWAVPQRSRA
ncbi:MAG TPA: hypothetical protein VF800_28220, partial [Telluria sp.]